MATIRFSRHALERMRERRISRDEVEEALNNVRIIKPGFRGRVNRWGFTRRGRRLRITQPGDDRTFVITVVAPDEDEA